MKKLGFFIGAALCVALMGTPARGQISGDFRSKANGSWNATGTWETFDGAAWNSAVSTPGSASSVFIQAGHTVTLSQNEACNDLNLNTASGTTRLALGANTLSVNGKLRAYSSAPNAFPVTYTATLSGTSAWITSTTGKISVVGNTRTLTSAGEWGAGNDGTSSPNGFDLEVNLNAGQTVTLNTNMKARSWTVSMGTVDAGINVIAADNGVAGQGDITIGASGTVISNQSGASAGNVVFQRVNGGSAGTLTVNGLLQLTGASPNIAMSSINFTGTVEYSRSGTQTLAVATSGGANPSAYTNLRISGSNSKTPGLSTTVNGTLTLNGGTLAIGANTLTLKNPIAGTATSLTGGTTSSITIAGTASGINIPSSVTALNNLTLDNANGTTLQALLTVGGVLDLANGDITTTDSFTLFQTGTSSATATGDVVGSVNRGDLNVAGAKMFGNPNVRITKSAGTASDVTVKLLKGVTSLTGSVNRLYTITPNTAVLSGTLRLRYLDSELGTNSENTGAPCNLQLWRENTTTSTWFPQGSTDCNATSNWVELSGVTAFSPWTIAGPGAPTECKLETFTASRSEDGVVLEWQTGYEVNNIGFNVYREEQSGKLVRLTPHLVAGSALMVKRGTPLTAGLSYSWPDPETGRGDGVRYWLEDLDVSGQSTWHGPYWIDETRKPNRPPSPGKGRPVMINAINERELSARQEEQSYEPAGQLETKAKLGKVTIAGLAQQAVLAGKPAVKISVTQEGWYRVSQPQLLAAGLSPSVNPRKLQLFVDGQQIPILVRGEKDGKLDAPDTIEFYGLGLDTASTSAHVYWLIAGSEPGDRIEQSPVSGGASGGASAGASFPYTVQRKDRLYYFSNIKNGETENFFGAFIYNQPTDLTLNLAHIALAVSAKLEVALQGFSAVPHQIAVSVNGALVGTVNFKGQAYSVSQLTFPQALLTEGANTVTMIALAGTNDFSFVDYVRLTYAHSFNADSNLLKFTASSGCSVHVGGFSDPMIRVVDITGPRSAQETIGKASQEAEGYSITVTTTGRGNRTLLAFTDPTVKQPVSVAANKPSNWRYDGNRADLVIISHGSFSSSLEPLKSLRQSQGLTTELVDVEDVYDEFSYGHKTPQALRDFLAYAGHNWKKAPRYVLLGGTASFDPRNYLALGNTDFVPAKFLETALVETASDDWFADFNNDGIPEMAVGRLPARTSQEATAMVQKLINYDQGAKGEGVLLVADVNDGFDFESVDNQLRALVPASMPLQEIRRGGDPSAKQHLLESLNQGKKLVNYAGHGSVDLRRANLLNAADAATLTNSRKLSIVVAMTCLNGYFFDERFESLAHALMNASGGAAAIWSSSGLTTPGGQALANKELFRQIFGARSVRLGDATMKAKAAVSDIDVRRTWILIGDPTTRLK